MNYDDTGKTVTVKSGAARALATRKWDSRQIDGKQGIVAFWFNKGLGGGEHIAVRIDGALVAVPPEYVVFHS